jgi:hypothetical protein
MSVDPVKASTAKVERQTPERKTHADDPLRGAVSGPAPKAEIVTTEINPVTNVIPEHEVTVELDTPTDNIVVYKVLDKKSGSLVLQVPSAEAIRGIHHTQELLQQIAARGKTATPEEPAAPIAKGKGNSDGSKL